MIYRERAQLRGTPETTRRHPRYTLRNLVHSYMGAILVPSDFPQKHTYKELTIHCHPGRQNSCLAMYPENPLAQPEVTTNVPVQSMRNTIGICSNVLSQDAQNMASQTILASVSKMK